MRPAREITAEEENFRTEPLIPGCDRFEMIKRDPVEPEPIGTIIMMAFRIIGYDQDCDGSLMARLEGIDKDGNPTGFDPEAIGISPNCDLVVTEQELRELFA